MNVNISFLEEINIVIESNLTPTELFVIRLLYMGIDGDLKPLQNYVENVSDGRVILRKVLGSLVNKKVINSTYIIPKEGESLNVHNIPFNKNFLKKYIRESNELGKEFFEEYPSFIDIKGKLVSIKNFTKANLFSFEDFCLYYSKSIKNCPITHNRVMDAVKFGKEHGLINYSIIEFIASKKYLEIEYLRDTDNINGYNNSELI